MEHPPGYCQIASRQARLVSRRHDSDVALLHMAGVEGMETSGQVSRIWGGVSASLLSLVDSGAVVPVGYTDPGRFYGTRRLGECVSHLGGLLDSEPGRL